MKTIKALILFLSCFLLVSSQGSLYAQKKVGALTFETVRPTAGNGQEIVYKDKSNQEVKVEYGTLVVPERHDKPESEQAATYEAMLNDSRERNRKCAESLRSQGIDLSAYNMNESADDLEDLRKALGAKKISLLGFSGGATLALATLRRHGPNLDRVVMAGIEGTAHMNKLPSNIQKQLVKIDALVKADPKISKLVPDLLGLMKSVLDKFEKEPVTIELTDSKTKQKFKVKIGKYVLQAITALMIGTTDKISLLPIFYYALSKGDTSLLTQLINRQNNRTISGATASLMDCASGVSKERQEQIRREAGETLLGDAINFPFPEGCDVWGSPDLGDSFRSQVSSPVPTLLISGALDGFTPVSNAEEVAKGLSNSIQVIVEGGGHEDLLTGAQKSKEVVLEFMKGTPVSTKSIGFPPIKFKTID
jgi:pimeloyl-ACP methyl ester carboxylesterase